MAGVAKKDVCAVPLTGHHGQCTVARSHITIMPDVCQAKHILLEEDSKCPDPIPEYYYYIIHFNHLLLLIVVNVIGGKKIAVLQGK